MVRVSKPKSSEQIESTEKVVPTVVETPVTEKVVKAKKPKAIKSVETSVDDKPVSVVHEVVVEPSVETITTDHQNVVVDEQIVEQSIDFLTKLQQLGVLVSSLKTEYRILEKKWTRDLKTAQKQSSKRKRKTGNRAPSGFVKPTRISDELASFLGKDTGTEMARTAVTRDINNYIRTNKLQDSTNGRKINPDSKLTALLKLKSSDELTYFNLQRYMSPHFFKNVKPVEPTETVVAA